MNKVPALAAMLLVGLLLARASRPPEQKPDSVSPLNATVESLIGRLVNTTEFWASGSDFAPLYGFDPSDADPRHRESPFRELVALGPVAVPILCRHLDDERPTGITVERYNFKVGDLCYIAIGQIVNRPFCLAESIPSNIVMTFAPTRELRARLRKEWGNLTPEQHRANLLKDWQKRGGNFSPARYQSIIHRDWESEEIAFRAGAMLRLGYYYPDALEGLALPFLTAPTFDQAPASTLVQNELYMTADASTQRKFFDAFVKGYGNSGRDGVRKILFKDLDMQEAIKEKRWPAVENFGDKARRLLIDLFSTPANVKARDDPGSAQSESDVAQVISIGLFYDSSPKIDRVISDIMDRTTSQALAAACMKRLIGRGYDKGIEAAYSRLKMAEGFSFPWEDPKDILARLGWAPLHVAVWRDQRERLRELIREGAPINSVGRDGQTPLHVAAADGNVDALLVLLAAGADQQAKDAQGLTPVATAAQAGHTHIARLLVNAGGPVPDILAAAAAGRTNDIARFLRVDPTSLQTTDALGRTPLHVAVVENQPAVIEQLLAGGASVAAVDLENNTPMHVAVALGREEACKVLLQRPGIIDENLVHLAAANGNLAIVKLLVARGAMLDQAGGSTHTRPLAEAARNGQLAVVEWLVEHGADVNARDFDEQSALDDAEYFRHPDVTAYLLSKGAK